VADKKIFLTKQVLTVSPPQEKILSDASTKFLERAHGAGIQGLEIKLLTREDKDHLRALTREGYLIVLDGTLAYSMEIYRSMVAKVLLGKPKGTLFSIADAKIHLPLSRKYIIPLLNRMEEDKLVERREDMRLVRWTSLHFELKYPKVML
jgi:selenocysteine-specific elongation factor